jgi:hypothetical protein
MANIQDKIKACDYVIANMLSEQKRIIYKNEDVILRLNKLQFIDGYGSDDKNLFNAQRQYSGIYKQGYKKQGLYDFFETGTFQKNMYIFMAPNNQTLFIDSSGKGSGEKSLFFAGYTNLFGLNSKSEHILNYDIILPELLKWIKKYL